MTDEEIKKYIGECAINGSALCAIAFSILQLSNALAKRDNPIRPGTIAWKHPGDEDND